MFQIDTVIMWSDNIHVLDGVKHKQAAIQSKDIANRNPSWPNIRQRCRK